MLARRQEETTYAIIPSTVRIFPCFSTIDMLWTCSEQYLQDITFLYNVQHDCPLAKCTASGKHPLIQERVESGLFKTYIEHRPINRFVINTHAFHNAHHLRAALERSLIVPIPLYPQKDRIAKHVEIAHSLRVTQKTKLEAQAEKKRKKKEVVMPTDKTGSVISKKRTRSEMEAEADEREVITH